MKADIIPMIVVKALYYVGFSDSEFHDSPYNSIYFYGKMA